MDEAATDIQATNVLPVIWKRMVRRLLETNNGALGDYLSTLNLSKAYTNFLQLQQIVVPCIRTLTLNALLSLGCFCSCRNSTNTAIGVGVAHRCRIGVASITLSSLTSTLASLAAAVAHRCRVGASTATLASLSATSKTALSSLAAVVTHRYGGVAHRL